MVNQRHSELKVLRAPRGLTREQAAIWTVVHAAFGAVWLSLDLANRLLGEKKPISQMVRRLTMDKRSITGKRLSAEQVAVGELMCAAVREYSESHYAAGWLSNIEHWLWDEVMLRKEDAYERACVRLHKLAGEECWRRPRRRSPFAEGLKLLSKRFGIWFFYETGKGERVIVVRDWLPRHEAWIQEGIRQRRAYADVWKVAHFELGRKQQRPVPPMPRIKLPPIRPANEH